MKKSGYKLSIYDILVISIFHSLALYFIFLYTALFLMMTKLRCKIALKDVYFILALAIVLLCFCFVELNYNNIRFVIVVPFLYLATIVLKSNADKFNFVGILDYFVLSLSVLIISAKYLSAIPFIGYVCDVSGSRYSCLLGNDMTAFIISTTVVFYIISRKTLTTITIFKILINTLALVLTGRFGIVLLGFTLIIVLISNFTLRKFLALTLATLLIGYFGHDRVLSLVLFLSSNFAQVGDFLIGATSLNVSDSALARTDGFYQNSPLVWLAEVKVIIWNFGDYIFPSSTKFLDSGIFFIIANMGIIVGCSLYIFQLRLLNIVYAGSNSKLIFLMFFVMDLKFRSIFQPIQLIFIVIVLLALRQIMNNKGAYLVGVNRAV